MGFICMLGGVLSILKNRYWSSREPWYLIPMTIPQAIEPVLYLAVSLVWVASEQILLLIADSVQEYVCDRGLVVLLVGRPGAPVSRFFKIVVPSSQLKMFSVCEDLYWGTTSQSLQR